MCYFVRPSGSFWVDFGDGVPGALFLGFFPGWSRRSVLTWPLARSAAACRMSSRGPLAWLSGDSSRSFGCRGEELFPTGCVVVIAGSRRRLSSFPSFFMMSSVGSKLVRLAAPQVIDWSYRNPNNSRMKTNKLSSATWFLLVQFWRGVVLPRRRFTGPGVAVQPGIPHPAVQPFRQRSARRA